jgi:hypothetical protein
VSENNPQSSCNEYEEIIEQHGAYTTHIRRCRVSGTSLPPGKPEAAADETA